MNAEQIASAKQVSFAEEKIKECGSELWQKYLEAPKCVRVLFRAFITLSP